MVADKTEAVYRRIFERHTEGPEHTIMAGNSLKSDILPALATGACAAYVPHDLTWSYEHAEEPEGEPRYTRIEHLGQLQSAIDRFEALR